MGTGRKILTSSLNQLKGWRRRCGNVQVPESKEPQEAVYQSTLLDPGTFHRSDLSVNWLKGHMVALSWGTHLSILGEE